MTPPSNQEMRIDPLRPLTEKSWLKPDWGAPVHVHACSTLRSGGVSRAQWGGAGGSADGLNLALHCGDANEDVLANRALLREQLPAEPLWLEQIHGTTVHDADLLLPEGGAVLPRADAAMTARAGVVLAVLTADCLPILFTNASGSVVGLAHAGWRGLAGGVVQATVDALAERTHDHQWLAWLGPAIGPSHFEVGMEVRDAFVDQDPGAAAGFAGTANPEKCYGDLFWLARRRLEQAGVTKISGGGLCTVSDPARFYSYRRDRMTGRMASLIWIE